MGVGKTSLCHILSEHYEVGALFEDADSHPLIIDFYNQACGAIETEVLFLIMHYRTLLLGLRSSSNIVFSDFSLLKQLAYASVNLSQPEYKAFLPLYELFDSKMREPQWTILLEADISVIMSRIRGRSRKYEANVTLDYVGRVKEAYDVLYSTRDQSRIIRIDCNDIDFVNDGDSRKYVTELVAAYVSES
jgi:deoxyguanosine kinase